MTPRQKNDALTVLITCKTLTQANDLLAKVRPILTKATRYGLWDGFAGKPTTLGGLTNDKEPDPEVARDYNEAVEVGRELSMRGTPA